jgi:hypothetical protein
VRVGSVVWPQRLYAKRCGGVNGWGTRDATVGVGRDGPRAPADDAGERPQRYARIVYRMIGRFSERLAHSRKPARLKTEAGPVKADTLERSASGASIG